MVSRVCISAVSAAGSTPDSSTVPDRVPRRRQSRAPAGQARAALQSTVTRRRAAARAQRSVVRVIRRARGPPRSGGGRTRSDEIRRDQTSSRSAQIRRWSDEIRRDQTRSDELEVRPD